ncbi:MAG TPA: aminotransferase class V-fold PLP-dependent enzyme, partial [Patescibacteria group bacterium]
LRDEIGVKFVYLPLNKDFRLDYKKVKVDFKKVKLIALAQASNVLGTVNPVSEIANFFKQNGSYAKLLIDAAQSIPHLPIDVQKLDADFLAFSSHKMLGPSGVGVLYAKKELLDIMDPLLVGSHIIKKVTKEKVTWTTAPDKFEPGTRNIEGVIGLGAAIDYLQQIGMEKIAVYEKELTTYALEMFKKHKITLFGPITFKNRLGVFSFAVGSVHPHDTAEILNRKNIAVRSGHHCAEPLMTCLGVSGTARASLYLYNTKEDVDKLFEGIELVKKTFKV